MPSESDASTLLESVFDSCKVDTAQALRALQNDFMPYHKSLLCSMYTRRERLDSASEGLYCPCRSFFVLSGAYKEVSRSWSGHIEHLYKRTVQQ